MTPLTVNRLASPTHAGDIYGGRSAFVYLSGGLAEDALLIIDGEAEPDQLLLQQLYVIAFHLDGSASVV
jgi:hypothetical protein